MQVHRLFLLTRDYAGIAFMLLVVFGAIGFFEIATCKTASCYVLVRCWLSKAAE
jgi:hypothetical protein